MSSPSLPSSSSPAPGHYAWLDWIRFLASFLVVIAHTRYSHFAPYAQLEVPGKGPVMDALFLLPAFANEAVMIFFVLSGYLVGGRCIERLLLGTFDAKSYALDRVTRIWIPLIPAVVLTWIAELICGDPPAIRNGLENLLALQEFVAKPMTHNAPLWTLSYEIWFYVLAFGVGLVITGKKPAVKTFAMLLTCVGMATFIRLNSLNLFIWMMGALAYLVPGRKGAWWQLAIGLGAIFGGTVLSALATELSTFAPGTLPFPVPPRKPSLALLGMGFALSLPVIVASFPVSGLWSRVERLGTRLAAFSYSLYLTHWPLLYLWSHFEGNQKHERVDLGSIAIYGVKVVVCIAFSWLFYLAFEKHTPQVRRWLSRKFLVKAK